MSESQHGRGWKGPLWITQSNPCRSRVTQRRLHRTLSRRVWNISREGDSITSLGSLCQGSVTLRGKKFFLRAKEHHHRPRCPAVPRRRGANWRWGCVEKSRERWLGRGAVAGRCPSKAALSHAPRSEPAGCQHRCRSRESQHPNSTALQEAGARGEIPWVGGSGTSFSFFYWS